MGRFIQHTAFCLWAQGGKNDHLSPIFSTYSFAPAALFAGFRINNPGIMNPGIINPWMITPACSLPAFMRPKMHPPVCWPLRSFSHSPLFASYPHYTRSLREKGKARPLSFPQTTLPRCPKDFLKGTSLLSDLFPARLFPLLNAKRGPVCKQALVLRLKGGRGGQEKGPKVVRFLLKSP